LSRRAVFLDRDGVLNERAAPHEYVRSWSEFRWLPGAPEAVAELAAAGFVPIVVSNQRGVARGLVSWEALAEIEAGMQRALAERGVRVEAWYYCPHDTVDGCDCRKPAPGLLLRAAEEWDVDTAASVMIGDSETDVIAGRAAGCLTVRVGPDSRASSADLVADDLAAASALLRARAR
jgi:D-glycero-D-manno-heptose 1,7-bisphosphate phosphatase